MKLDVFISAFTGALWAFSVVVIIGLDLRKPKLFEEFNLTNDVGLVNYLIKQKTLDEIINKTSIPYLDVIISGPTPPNPAELIMSDGMKEMFKELKQKYDYIILDTPPVGIVSDAMELAQFSDVVLYIIRQNFTKKEMITMLNNSVKRGELNNISIVLNGFQNKAKYGAGYGYGYGSQTTKTIRVYGKIIPVTGSTYQNGPVDLMLRIQLVDSDNQLQSLPPLVE